jgi:hypothetical protein
MLCERSNLLGRRCDVLGSDLKATLAWPCADQSCRSSRGAQSHATRESSQCCAACQQWAFDALGRPPNAVSRIAGGGDDRIPRGLNAAVSVGALSLTAGCRSRRARCARMAALAYRSRRLARRWRRGAFRGFARRSCGDRSAVSSFAAACSRARRRSAFGLRHLSLPPSIAKLAICRSTPAQPPETRCGACLTRSRSSPPR